MEAGFGWEIGPFACWDALGLKSSVMEMEKLGYKPAPWIYSMMESGATSFYKSENGIRKYYNVPTKSYLPVEGQQHFIILDNYKQDRIIWKNSGCNILDIGEGVLCLEFQTKMNTMGGEIVQGVHKAIELAEKDFRGLVIGNDGPNFSAGANLALILMMAIEQDFDEIDMAVRAFQQMNMRIRYSAIPVVVAPHGLTLGGGCEMSLHADRVQAAAETYTGLVEFGVGLIPGGGGSKEFALRFADELHEGDIELNAFRERFLTIAMAKVSTSAQEAFNLGFYKSGRDQVTINQRRY